LNPLLDRADVIGMTTGIIDMEEAVALTVIGIAGAVVTGVVAEIVTVVVVVTGIGEGVLIGMNGTAAAGMSEEGGDKLTLWP